MYMQSSPAFLLLEVPTDVDVCMVSLVSDNTYFHLWIHQNLKNILSFLEIISLSNVPGFILVGFMAYVFLSASLRTAHLLRSVSLLLEMAFSIIMSPVLHTLERGKDGEKRTILRIKDKGSAASEAEAFILV